MADDTEARLVHALLEGTALPGCPAVSQHIMGMALAIYLHDCKLVRPWDRFATYLAAYTAVQDLEAEALSLLTTHYRAAQGEG